MNGFSILGKILRRLLFAAINAGVLLISFLIPKTDQIVVVGGWFGERFADNSKYFFLYANAYKDDLHIKKIVWITRSSEIFRELRRHGYHVYKAWSLCSIWYHLRAKVHLIDQSIMDLNPFFSVRSKRVNMWHGFPLKKIGAYQDRDGDVKGISRNKLIDKIIAYSTPGCWGIRYLLATSEFSARVMAKAFNLPLDRIILSGYPRNFETITDRPLQYVCEKEKPFLGQIKSYREKGAKIIGYFPTFRDKRETIFFGTDDMNELQDLLDFLRKANIRVVLKPHFTGKNGRFIEWGGHDALITLPLDADIYSFLSQIDILITDYSSIYFDFLLWKKPIIFFPYDLEYYCSEDRGLIFDYCSFTPGPKVFAASELKELLQQGVQAFTEAYMKEYQDEAMGLCRRIFGNVEEMKIANLMEQIRSTNTLT